jgi:hypothetical protein
MPRCAGAHRGMVPALPFVSFVLTVSHLLVCLTSSAGLEWLPCGERGDGVSGESRPWTPSYHVDRQIKSTR